MTLLSPLLRPLVSGRAPGPGCRGGVVLQGARGLRSSGKGRRRLALWAGFRLGLIVTKVSYESRGSSSSRSSSWLLLGSSCFAPLLGLRLENFSYYALSLIHLAVTRSTGHALPHAELAEALGAGWGLSVDQATDLAYQDEAVLGGGFVLAEEDVEDAVVPVRLCGGLGWRWREAVMLVLALGGLRAKQVLANGARLIV